MGTIAQKGTYHGIRHADLQSKGVRCWFASEDMKIGDCLRPRLDETIRLYTYCLSRGNVFDDKQLRVE